MCVHSTMKFFAVSVIAVCLFGAAAAVTFTIYTDGACTTALTSTSTLPNPIVATLNTCTKYITTPGLISVSTYVKATACATGNMVTGAIYGDEKCTESLKISDLTGAEGKCIPLAVGSQKITCDPASSVTLASITVVAAVLAFCM